MNNIDFYNATFCGFCVRGDCASNLDSCNKCRADCGGDCPCKQTIENVNKPCEYFEMNLPKGEIFESIKRGFKAYLIGKYGTEKEKHEYELNLNYSEDNMSISNHPKREEIQAILKHMLCKIMYEMGDFENEN